MSTDSKLSSLMDEISKKPIFNYLDREVSYTLAAHGSHRSHQSHGSHRSHRSYHKPMDPQDEREIRGEFHSTSFHVILIAHLIKVFFLVAQILFMIKKLSKGLIRNFLILQEVFKFIFLQLGTTTAISAGI